MKHGASCTGLDAYYSGLGQEILQEWVGVKWIRRSARVDRREDV